MGCTGSKEETKEQAPLSTLDKGGKVEKGKALKSANGNFTLILQDDGNLVLYDGDEPKWASDTVGKEVTHLAITEAGDVAVFNGDEQVWSAGVEGAATLLMQDDRNVVAYNAESGPVWATNTVKEEAPAAAEPEPVDTSAYDLRTKKAVVAKRGPIGVEVEEGKTYYWCTCGKSKNQPFCDGSHAGTDFTPMAWTAPETKEVYLCACKQTKNAPFCDGTHAQLAENAEGLCIVDETAYDLRSREAVVAKRGPLPVTVEEGKTYYWCTCGKSKNQPFCDGSHAGSDFTPIAWTAPETKEVYFCVCKKTKTAPLCDGSHLELPYPKLIDTTSRLYKNCDLRPENGAAYSFKLQGDGNLVLYDGDEPKWASDTVGKEVTHLAITEAGDVAVFNGDEQVWSAGVEGAATLLMQDDRNVVAYNAEGAPVWATNTVKEE